MLTKELNLKGLDCPNCAAKIEDEVSALQGVHANVNLMKQTITLELQSESMFSDVLPKIEDIVHKHEPDVEVSEYTNEYASGQAGSAGALAKAAAATAGTTSAAAAAGRDAAINSVTATSTALTTATAPTTAPAPTKAEAEESPWEENKATIARLVAGGFGLILAMFLPVSQTVKLALYLISYLIVGGHVLVSAAKGIARGQVFSEHFLMSIATIGAFLIGEYPEAIAVMLFYLVGELFQDLAVGHSRRSISALLKIRPESANLQVGSEIRQVAPEEVKPGDVIVVRPGERVPLDGVILTGTSTADTSALTGESMPRDLAPGDEALSGFINQSGLLTVEVTKPFGESTVSKILDLVQNASGRKAPTEKFITKFARYYTPVVVFAALALAIIPPLVIPGQVFSDWLYRALVFLVVSCPCALVVSIPLGFFGGIGGASRRGILVKGSNYLEALNQVDTIVFDKTGTLTKGTFEVTDIVPAKDTAPNDLLELTAYAESFSNHPIARSILRRYGKKLDMSRVENGREIAGGGLAATVDGREILVGNERLLAAHGVNCPAPAALGTVVYLAVDGEYAGQIIIADQVKDDAADALKELKDLGIRKTVMLTGDSRAVGEAIGREVHVDEVHSELLPADKVEHLEALAETAHGKVAAVGDGINDAPLLARADIGIAMGGLGSDAAIEAADIVIMTDEPSKIADAIRIARRTRRIVYQNIIMALAIKAIFLILGAMGLASMWAAVFADVGVTILAVFNSLRAMNTKWL